MAKERVFADTNVILEAFRVGCWSILSNRYAIETVEKCAEETQAGDRTNPRYVPVDATVLKAGLAACHPVTNLEIATFALDRPRLPVLDDGELHLLAWLHARPFNFSATILISTADKAAIVATSQLGWLDSVVCLEDLAATSGTPRAQLDRLANHHRAAWLSSLKTRIQLGMYP